jgi:8-oxo-dGTP pyrophosphatase MutT (NUDIX family)
MVLLRGHFVSVVTVLIDSSTNEKYFLLVKQRRVANGSIFFEHPAGMCDNEIDPYKVAIKEVMEETGLTIFKEDLHLLWDKPLYSSPGLLDEAGYFFYCEVKLDSKELNSFRNKITGAKDENEHIETFLCPSHDILKYIENSNGVLASLLYLQKSV